MSFKKHIFEQFGNTLGEEVKKYKAIEEKKAVRFRRCNHKNARIVDGVLRCSCGASWRGTRLDELLNLLTKGSKWPKQKKKKK